MEKRRGVTWVELLVVVLVLGLLVLILMPSIERPPSGAKKARCSANLSGIGKTLYLYSAMYKESPLPDSGGGSGDLRWLTDQTATFRALMLGRSPGAKVEGDKYSPVVKGFYCPSNFDSVESRWQHGSVSVWGYAMLNDRGSGAAG